MSFFNLGYSLTNINSILERDEFTLEELLDEHDVVQECSKDNKQLVEFLSKPPVLLQMLEFAIGAPDENADEAVRYKYPSVATDILSVGVYGICQGLISSDKVWDGKTLMQRLWSFLDCPSPLNPLLASYFSKIAGGLLQKKSTDVLAFIRQDKTILDKLLANMGTSAIMELLTSIFGDRDLKHANGVMEWLTEEKLVMRLVKHVSSSSSADMQANASQALVEVVSLNKLTIEYLGPDPIVTHLYDQEILDMLVQQLLSPDASGVLVSNGIDILLSLMNAGQLPATGDEQVQQLSEGSLMQLSLQSAQVGKVLASNVGKFLDMLKTNAPTKKVMTTFGVLDPPFGTHRLKIVELFMAMVANPKLVKVTMDALVTSKVAETMYDYFFTYLWNNMLHSLVERFVVSVLEYGSIDEDAEMLVRSVLFDAKLLERILLHTNENKDRNMGDRAGYMGSVYIMINAINGFFTSMGQPEYVADLRSLLSDEWKEYIAVELPLVNEKNERPLGGHRPNNQTDDDDDFDVGGDAGSDINQDLAYMRFLSQQISSAPSNDDFLSSSSDEDADLSDELSDEDDGDRIFRPAVQEDAFAPDAKKAESSMMDDTNGAITAAFTRASIADSTGAGDSETVDSPAFEDRDSRDSMDSRDSVEEVFGVAQSTIAPTVASFSPVVDVFSNGSNENITILLDGESSESQTVDGRFGKGGEGSEAISAMEEDFGAEESTMEHDGDHGDGGEDAAQLQADMDADNSKSAEATCRRAVMDTTQDGDFDSAEMVDAATIHVAAQESEEL